MSNLTYWKFKGTESVFSSPSTALQISVSRLRKALNLHPEHEIIVLNDNNSQPNEPVTDVTNPSDSNQYVDQSTAVSDSVKKNKTVEKTAELPSVSGDMGSTDSESDVL
jgi:hypothetical protein